MSEISVPKLSTSPNLTPSVAEPGVTVVIPCFNGEHHLGRTIDSLLQQDCLPDEIVVIDDGSVDGTRRVANSYGGIVKLVSQKNAGAASARYCGVLNAAKDIVVFIDAGDKASPSKVRLFKMALADNPACVCAFGVAWNTSYPRPECSKITERPFDDSFTVVADPFRWILSHHWPAAGVMDVAIRRSVALQSLDVPGFYQAANDYAAQIRTALHGPFVHVAAITSEYVFLPKGITSRYGVSLQIGFALCAAVEAYESVPDEKSRRVLEKRVITDLPRGLLASYLKKRWPLLKRLVRIQLRYGSMSLFPRHMWWALKNAHSKSELEKGSFLCSSVRALTSLLGRVRRQR